MKTQVIVIGAGVSGLTLGLKLARQGTGVVVLEAENAVGGLAGTVRENGNCMDVGPHSLFSEDTEILNTVLDLFHNSLTPIPRRVKFYYRGKYLDYPLTAYSVLVQLGLWSGLRVGSSFLTSKVFGQRSRSSAEEEETVEDWAIRSFGRHLYEVFFRPYTEQFWKMPCTELSSRTIPSHTRMSFFNTLRLLLRRRMTEMDSSLIEREMLPTYYPPSGFAEIPEKIARAAGEAGAQVLTGCRVVKVDRLDDGSVKVLYETNGEGKEIEGVHVVSTIALTKFVPMLNPPAPHDVLAASEKLEYLALCALGMVTHKQNILKCGYIYVLDRPYNRVSEMNEFSPATSSETENIIMIEIPCLKDSAAWRASKEELLEMCIGSLAKDGILGPGDVKGLLLARAPDAYPIYRKDYVPNLRTVLNYIDSQDWMSTLGRTGEFIYMDIDKCMRRALEFADELLKHPELVKTY